MLDISSPRKWAALSGAAVFLATVSLAGAAGVQFSRDRGETLVNKDVGDERWAISYRLSDGRVTGNVTIRDDEAPVFLDCTQESVSPSDVGTYRCYTADACPEEPCLPGEWSYLSTVPLSRSFFFPPGETPDPGACTSWFASLSRDEVNQDTCSLRLTIDNSRCPTDQTNFQDVLLNCSGEQINLSSRFSSVSVGARQTVMFPLSAYAQCINKEAVVELELGGTRKKTNEISCSVACTANSDPCDENRQCCSNRCGGPPGGEVCRPTTCLQPEAQCESSSDCCNLSCARTSTGFRCESGSCRALTQTCEGDDCCAGGECERVGSVDRCVLVNCRAVGQTCEGDSDCCSDKCESLNSSESFCVARTEPCREIGESCGEGEGECCSDGECEGTGLGPDSGGATCVAISPPLECSSDQETFDCTSVVNDCADYLEIGGDDGDYFCQEADDGSCERGELCVAG